MYGSVSRRCPLLLPVWLAWLAPSLAAAQAGSEVKRAVGVNLSADESFGARQAGMAVDFAAFQRGADAAANAPAAMNDVDDFTFSTAHAEKFGRAQFDDFAFVLPFAADATMGLAFSRFGVSDIELRPEDSDPLAARPQGLFTAADYVVTGAFARRWGNLDVGFSLDLLYRHLDQNGMGLRADGMAQYTWDGRNRLSMLVKGLVPSSAHWESGYTEYELPDLFIGGSHRTPVPYFYGTLETSFQTAGLFSEEGKSQSYVQAGTVASNLPDLLAATRVGAEFQFDFGLAVRAGLTEIAPHNLPSTATFGIGYNWRNILGLDYSFTPHPDLLSTHRISLQATPAFPKLDGRGYRPRSAAARPAGAPAAAPAIEEGEILEYQPVHPASPAAPPIPAPPADAAPSEAPGASAPPSAPEPVSPPASGAPTAPAGEIREILETGN